MNDSTPRHLSLVQGTGADSSRPTSAEQTLRKAQFRVFAAMADGKTVINLDEVARWVNTDTTADVPDEVA